MYGLNPDLPVFRALRQPWRKYPALPLLAILCNYGRDPTLYHVAPFILKHKPGDEISSQAEIDFLKKKQDDRVGQGSINSASRNIRSTFTQRGHWRGIRKKFAAATIKSQNPGRAGILL